MPDLSDLNFDPSAIEPDRPIEPLPPGPYAVVVTNTSLRETKSGSGTYLEIEMEVVEGDHKGKRIWDRLNLRNPSDTAVEIGMRRLSSICRILGLERLPNSELLHGKTLVATVAHRDRDGRVNVDVKGYAASKGAAPAKRVEAVPAAGGAKTPPWKRAG
jgi:hypothetical protein